MVSYMTSDRIDGIIPHTEQATRVLLARNMHELRIAVFAVCTSPEYLPYIGVDCSINLYEWGRREVS